MIRTLRSTLALATFALASLVHTPAASAQTLYETDVASGNVYAFTPTGNRSTFASGFGSFNIAGIAVDSSSNVYVADRDTSSIVKISADGTLRSTFASTSNFVNGIKFDSNGNLFVTNRTGSASSILKITPGGMVSTFVSGLNNPVDVAFDSTGNLFVSDALANAIYKYLPDGTNRTTFASNLGRPQGLAIDSSGNLFEADINSSSILKFTPNGTQTTFATGLDNPYGLAFDSTGNLFEADNASNSILKFTPGGTQTTFASGLNGPFFLAFAPTPSSVPEPGSVAFLAGLSVTGTVFLRRRKAVKNAA